MKKFFGFAVACCLSACGGAGVNDGISVERAAVDSNSHVTGMLTYLETDDNGNTLDSRVATRRTSSFLKHAGKYDLSDVNFNIADEGFGGVVKFSVDKNKKITGFSVVDDETELNTVDGKLVYKTPDIEDVQLDGNGVLTTTNPNATISGPDENGIWTYSNDNDDMNGLFIVKDNEFFQLYEGGESATRVVDGKRYASMNFNRTGDKDFTFAGRINGENGETDATLTYNSFGKDVKLKYSDFGYFQLESDGDKDRPVSFVGGYDIKRINPKDLGESEMNFSGRAVGSVIAFRNGHPELLELDTTEAGVNFKDGHSKLTAVFDNWYTVRYDEQYDSSGDAMARNINLSNYVDTPVMDDDNQPVANYFRAIHDTPTAGVYAGDGDAGLDLATVLNDGYNGDKFDSIQSDIRYYGDNGTPSEVAGLIQLRDCAGNNCGDVGGHHNDEIRMNVSFGGK